jgi:hypothetical protein
MSTRKRTAPQPATEHAELRAVSYGSTYWLRSLGRDLWHVTADGVSISSPASYEQAAEAFRAVTAS